MKRKLNKPLLRRLARKLRRLRHEEHYEQRAWVAKTDCGTSACIGGMAAAEAGWKLLFGEGYGYCRKDGKRRSIRRIASKMLGLAANTRLLSAYPTGSWPFEYAYRYEAADPTGPAKQRPSRVAADLLDALADGTVEPF